MGKACWQKKGLVFICILLACACNADASAIESFRTKTLTIRIPFFAWSSPHFSLFCHISWVTLLHDLNELLRTCCRVTYKVMWKSFRKSCWWLWLLNTTRVQFATLCLTLMTNCVESCLVQTILVTQWVFEQLANNLQKLMLINLFFNLCSRTCQGVSLANGRLADCSLSQDWCAWGLIWIWKGPPPHL